MERKRKQVVVGLMLVMAVLGISPTTAHVPPAACIQHCLRECRVGGIGPAACFKYCPLHCLPSDTTEREHNCSLACMLDECPEYKNDEKRMTECIVKCRRTHCHIDA